MRSFTPGQVENLKRFIAEGGAFYGSWGGPMSTPALLQVCHVATTRSAHISGMTLLESPLSQGIDQKDRYIQFPEVVGHARGSWIWERVVITPLEGGIPVAKDVVGNILGVLGEYGKGRTAVLGF